MQLILHLVWESQLLKMDFLHYVLLCLWLFVKDNAAALMDLFIYIPNIHSTLPCLGGDTVVSITASQRDSNGFEAADQLEPFSVEFENSPCACYGSSMYSSFLP